MVILYMIVAVALLAIIFRRDISTIGKYNYKGKLAIVITIASLFVLQIVLVIFAPGRFAFQPVVLIASQIIVLFLVLLNHHLPGAKLFALGAVLNLAVLTANGGLMPISPETYKLIHPEQEVIELHTKPPASKNIVLPRNETKLWILSDIIPVSLPWRTWAISIGDILIVLAAAQFLFGLDITIAPKACQ
jgi:hypothetical protein